MLLCLSVHVQQWHTVVVLLVCYQSGGSVGCCGAFRTSQMTNLDLLTVGLLVSRNLDLYNSYCILSAKPHAKHAITTN